MTKYANFFRRNQNIFIPEQGQTNKSPNISPSECEIIFTVGRRSFMVVFMRFMAVFWVRVTLACLIVPGVKTPCTAMQNHQFGANVGHKAPP